MASDFVVGGAQAFLQGPAPLLRSFFQAGLRHGTQRDQPHGPWRAGVSDGGAEQVLNGGMAGELRELALQVLLCARGFEQSLTKEASVFTAPFGMMAHDPAAGVPQKGIARSQIRC